MITFMESLMLGIQKYSYNFKKQVYLIRQVYCKFKSLIVNLLLIHKNNKKSYFN